MEGELIDRWDTKGIGLEVGTVEITAGTFSGVAPRSAVGGRPLLLFVVGLFIVSLFGLLFIDGNFIRSLGDERGRILTG